MTISILLRERVGPGIHDWFERVECDDVTQAIAEAMERANANGHTIRRVIVEVQQS